jgi:hypothetical protein
VGAPADPEAGGARPSGGPELWEGPPVTGRHILSAWWPLAASWGLMGIEQPLIIAVVARLADPTIHLAAWGGVVFPLSLLIESPIIMLLAASTTLSRDRPAYRRLRRFTHTAGALLTLLHLAIAFTPLYDVVVGGLLGSPDPIREPGRLGLQLMTPWTWAIASRRFQQGLLIRSGHARAVGLGTAVRLVSDLLVLAIGYRLRLPGIAVAAAALSTGVVCEALYTALRVRPLVKRLPQSSGEAALRGWSFARFYVPLAMTSLLHLLVEPIGAAAMARMPLALDSLAVWPVLFGLIWVAMGTGIAYHEVVVSLLPRHDAAAALARFTRWLVVVNAAPVLLLAVTPLGALWFAHVAALPPALASLAASALWLGPPLPALTVLHSWYQGVLVHTRRTRAIPESLALFLVTVSSLAAAGVWWSGAAGLYVGLVAITAGASVQALWLHHRSASARTRLSAGEPGINPPDPAF